MSEENPTLSPCGTSYSMIEFTSVALNATDAIRDDSSPVQWVRVVLYLVIAFGIMFGNALVIAAVARYRFLQTPINLFVVGLASLDCAMGISGVLMALQFIQPQIMSHFGCLARVAFGCFNVVSSAMMLAGTLRSGWLLIKGVDFILLKQSVAITDMHIPHACSNKQTWIWRSKFVQLWCSLDCV